jgi:hypothetical protein
VGAIGRAGGQLTTPSPSGNGGGRPASPGAAGAESRRAAAEERRRARDWGPWKERGAWRGG